MSLNARHRVNPFDANVINSILITEEEHTIEYHPEPNAYGFYANEGILLDANDPVVLVQDNTAQTAFTEIPRTIAPSSGQFRVDYDEDGYYNTGFVQCNSSDNGKAVLFTYRGTGTLVHPTFRTLTDYNYAGNINVEGNATIAGNVVLADSTGSTISASGKKIEDVANPTAATDALTLGYFENNNSHFAFFTANGSFTVPAGVTELLVEIAGGGGGGSGGINSATGGGGGGQSKQIGSYTVTPGAVLAVTVGAGGAAGAANNGAGGNGGASSLGAVVSVNGGTGGANGAGGAGSGNAGVSGGSQTGESGLNGGNGGGGAPGGIYTLNPYTGSAGKFGGGGGGGATAGGTGYAGGAGGDGYVKIWW